MDIDEVNKMDGETGIGQDGAAPERQVKDERKAMVVIRFYEGKPPQVNFEGLSYPEIPLLLKRVAKDMEAEFLK